MSKLLEAGLLVVGGKVVGVEDDIGSRKQVKKEDEKSRATLNQLELKMRNVI